MKWLATLMLTGLAALVIGCYGSDGSADSNGDDNSTSSIKDTGQNSDAVAAAKIPTLDEIKLSLNEEGKRVAAMRELQKHYIESPDLQPILEFLDEGGPRSKANFVVKVKDDNPSDEIKAMAKALLAKWMAGVDPDKSKQFCDEVMENYADLEFGDGTLKDLLAKPLFAIKHLGVGKPAADISGPDTDGKEFKLSDYHGKVVMLDFWGDW